MLIMRYSLILLTFLLISTSCKLFRSNLMLKTPRDFKYDTLVDSLSRLDYKIATNDAIAYRVYTNNGYKLIDASNSSNLFRSDIDAVVQSDGNIKMPLLGNVYVQGLTITEAEKMIEEKYAQFYVEPYVGLKVNNKRVIIFPGNGGLARVLPLTNNNTTVMEAIANAGGILEDGKAYKVKLIRAKAGVGEKPYVYLMDLSNISGAVVGQSIVQAGDIIYVEPRYRPLTTFNKELTPLITLITSVLILYQFTRLTK